MINTYSTSYNMLPSSIYLPYGITNHSTEYYAENENLNATTTVVILNSAIPWLCYQKMTVLHPLHRTFQILDTTNEVLELTQIGFRNVDSDI